MDQSGPPQGSPQATLSPLSIGLAAHLFNGWQAPECPIPWVQGSTHSAPTRGPFLNSGKPLWLFFPPTAARRRMFALRVLIRCFSPSPRRPTHSASRPGCREHRVWVREHVPSPSGRPPRAPGRRENSAGCARALGPHPPPGAVTLRTSPPSPALPPLAVSSHHQADERKPRWRPFQA